MSYFKRLETILIVIVILILGVAYAIINSHTPNPKPAPAGGSSVQDSAAVEPTDEQQASAPVMYQGEDGRNALELLKEKHQVETDSFGDLGEFVRSIDGMEPDSSHFWSFYVNGQPAQVGASAHVTSSSETIEWRLEEVK